MLFGEILTACLLFCDQTALKGSHSFPLTPRLRLRALLKRQADREKPVDYVVFVVHGVGGTRKNEIYADQMEILDRLKPESTDSAVTEIRDSLSSAAADLIFYMTPHRKQAVITDVTRQLNAAH